MIKKPCPGCGMIDLTRKASSVCRECQNLIHDGKLWQEARVPSDCLIVAVGARSHWNQHIHAHSYTPRHYGYELMDFFHQLVLSVSQETSPSTRALEVLGKVDPGCQSYRVMPILAATSIQELRTTIQLALDAAYESGKQDGQSRVTRLAQEDITVRELI